MKATMEEWLGNHINDLTAFQLLEFEKAFKWITYQYPFERYGNMTHRYLTEQLYKIQSNITV